MNIVLRGAMAVLVGLSLSTALVMPAHAKPKHRLLVEKVELMTTVGQITLESHVAAILTNVDEDLGWTPGSVEP